MDRPAADRGFPATGLILLSLQDGSVKSSATVGSDPVAVAIAPNGLLAYLADSAPGDVYAVTVPALKVAWKAHVGGAPFGLLAASDRLYVSLYDSASIAVLDPSTGRLLTTDPTPPHPGALAIDGAGNVVAATGGAYGIAAAGGSIWTADYDHSTLVNGDRRIQLPAPLHPFWLAPGSAGTLLIAAEGAAEDADAGAVFSYSTMDGTFSTLSSPRDPDQAIQVGSTVLVAAHGDRRVLAISGGQTRIWAEGASAVGVAADAKTGLAAVVLNAHE